MAAPARSFGGAGVRGSDLGIHLLAAPRIRGFRHSGARASLGGEWDVSTRGDIELLPPAISVSRERALEVMEAIDNPAIAEEVIRQLGLDRSMEPAELLENLIVEVIAGIQFVQLSYRDTNPLRAQMISNAVAKVASEEVRQEAFVYGLRIHVWERASAPTDPVSPNPVRSGFLALVLGLAAGIGLALLMEWRTS
jgi:uncharacterized protein involved in exopolysaccharide biosynthesis